MNRPLLLAAACMLHLLLTGCATPMADAPVTADRSDFRYLLGPGDQIEILVWRNPELSAKVPVRPDGTITAPLVNDVVAAGKDTTALADEIQQRLGAYVVNPSVTVLVTQFVGASLEQIRVIGQARRPVALPYTRRMTVLDAMIAAGGLTEFAAGNRAVLVRGRDPSRKYRVRLEDLLNEADVAANAELLPGDVIVVPERWF